jgi:xanthine/uracil/vitamin C permease (AzgA family)
LLRRLWLRFRVQQRFCLIGNERIRDNRCDLAKLLRIKTFGNFHDARVQLSIVGFLITTVLLCRRVRGGILLGMVLTAALGYWLGFGQAPQAVAGLPFVGEYSLSPIAGQLDIKGVLQLNFWQSC